MVVMRRPTLVIVDDDALVSWSLSLFACVFLCRRPPFARPSHSNYLTDSHCFCETMYMQFCTKQEARVAHGSLVSSCAIRCIGCGTASHTSACWIQSRFKVSLSTIMLANSFFLVVVSCRAVVSAAVNSLDAIIFHATPLLTVADSSPFSHLLT
ncbi:unnamed protein product, partial [Polarella glacialis]